MSHYSNVSLYPPMRAEYHNFTSKYPQQTPNPVPPRIAKMIDYMIYPQYQFQVPEELIEQIELSCQRCDENNSDFLVICNKCYQAYAYSRQSCNPPTFSQNCPIQNPNYPVSRQQYAHGNSTYPGTTTPSFENVQLPSYPVPSQQHHYQFPAPIPNNFSSPIAHDPASRFATPPSFEDVQFSSIPMQNYPVRVVTDSTRQTFARHFTSLREGAAQRCDVDNSRAPQLEDPINKKRKITADHNSHESHSKNTKVVARRRVFHREDT